MFPCKSLALLISELNSPFRFCLYSVKTIRKSSLILFLTSESIFFLILRVKNITDQTAITFPLSDLLEEDRVQKKLKVDPLLVDRLMSNVLSLSIHGKAQPILGASENQVKKAENSKKDEEIRVLKERISKLANINKKLIEDANRINFN